ncbi:MAG: hypothetical protein M1827_002097 [Pycnora praestabilis]|nr:MAG: hypothetical protein M1827_002097 [Pycnora praestabilis]
MDPKMDSGYLAPGETLEDEYDVLRKVLPEEVLGIMDQLLCHEMAWHKGHPLSQTLFTSLYIDKLLWPEPMKLESAHFGDGGAPTKDWPLLHLILRAYCLGLIKSCDFVLRRIGMENCYEEEDFVTHHYNRKLLTDFPEPEITRQLDQALDWLNGEEHSVGEEVKAALRCRLDFRKSFLTAMAKDIDVIEDRSNPMWDRCTALLPSIEESSPLGKPVDESFSVKVQRKLASTVPPRPIVNITFDDASKHLKRLCQDGKDLIQVLDYQGVKNVLTYVWAFQSRKPQPSVYIRALLQSVLFSEMRFLGTMSLKQVLFDDLAEIVLPAGFLLEAHNSEIEVPSDPRFQIAAKMDQFVARAGQSYLDVFRAVCQNRTRTRRTLCHTIEDWDNLQLDVEEIDNELRHLMKEEPIVDISISSEPIFSFPLSSWAYHHKLSQMRWIVQLGFELEIYQPGELGGMYWYLQYLSQIHIHHLERIRGFVTRKISRTRKPKLHEKEASAKTLSFLNFSMLEATAAQGFADALSCFYTTLTRLHLLSTPPRPYSTDALRYELRMKPFLSIGLPELFPHEQFRDLVTQVDTSIAQLLEIADQAVKRARKDYDLLGKMESKTTRSVLCEGEWKKNVKDTLRACIATSIAISTVRKAVDKHGEGKLKVEIPPTGRGYHDWWAVPKITASA